jgi:hypothetical protein
MPFNHLRLFGTEDHSTIEDANSLYHLVEDPISGISCQGREILRDHSEECNPFSRPILRFSKMDDSFGIHPCRRIGSVVLACSNVGSPVVHA